MTGNAVAAAEQAGCIPFREMEHPRVRLETEQAQGVEVTDPEGKRPLTLGEAASAQSFQLTEAGYYQIRLANGRQDEIGVNPDPKESNLDVISDDVLALWKGGGSAQDASTPGVPPQTKAPQSLWWYLMVFALAFAVAESVLASRYLGILREDS